MEILKLHEIERGSKIRVDLEDGGEGIITFVGIDGMYSYCTLDGGTEKEVVHLSIGTPLFLGEDGIYEIVA